MSSATRTAALGFFLTSLYLNVLWLIDPVKAFSLGYQWAIVILYVVLMVRAVRARKAQLAADQYLTQRGALRTAAVVGVACTIGFHLTLYTLYLLQPETFETAQTQAIEQINALREALTGGQIEGTPGIKTENVFQFSFRAVLSAIATGIIGDFLLGLIIATLMTRRGAWL